MKINKVVRAVVFAGLLSTSGAQTQAAATETLKATVFAGLVSAFFIPDARAAVIENLNNVSEFVRDKSQNLLSEHSEKLIKYGLPVCTGFVAFISAKKILQYWSETERERNQIKQIKSRWLTQEPLQSGFHVNPRQGQQWCHWRMRGLQGQSWPIGYDLDQQRQAVIQKLFEDIAHGCIQLAWNVDVDIENSARIDPQHILATLRQILNSLNTEKENLEGALRDLDTITRIAVKEKNEFKKYVVIPDGVQRKYIKVCQDYYEHFNFQDNLNDLNSNRLAITNDSVKEECRHLFNDHTGRIFGRKNKINFDNAVDLYLELIKRYGRVLALVDIVNQEKVRIERLVQAAQGQPGGGAVHHANILLPGIAQVMLQINQFVQRVNRVERHEAQLNLQDIHNSITRLHQTLDGFVQQRATPYQADVIQRLAAFRDQVNRMVHDGVDRPQLLNISQALHDMQVFEQQQPGFIF